ncbi:MAG: glycosyltransferase [Myxococcales bacterium]|nr:glycosyltransferase [Myxococcales bacterium]
MSSLALFLPSLLGGGAERVMVELAGGFAERGHRTTLVVARRTGELSDQVPASVDVVDLGVRGTGSAVVPFARWLRARRPDAVLSAMTHTNVSALLARRLSRTRVRLVVSEHNAIAERIARATGPRQRLMYALARRLYRSADAVVGVSEGVTRELCTSLDLDVAGTRAIYNPVVSERVLRAAEAPVDHPWIDAEVPLVLAVGRLVPQKGFDTLVRAFARVRAERPARLVILGEGPERPRLQALIGELGLTDDAGLPGFVPNPHAWMRRASVFACSSVWEGFGVVIAEALAAGCPVVSTDCPHGPDEILEHGAWGRLVPVGDADALARGIVQAIDEGRDAVGDDARRGRASRFTVDAAVQAYLELLLPST